MNVCTCEISTCYTKLQSNSDKVKVVLQTLERDKVCRHKSKCVLCVSYQLFFTHLLRNLFSTRREVQGDLVHKLQIRCNTTFSLQLPDKKQYIVTSHFFPIRGTESNSACQKSGVPPCSKPLHVQGRNYPSSPPE